MDDAGVRGGGAAAESADWPADAVEVGRIVDAWGVKGWVKVDPYATDPQALLASKHWFLRHDERPLSAATLHVTGAREQGGTVVAGARELADRNAAEALRGARVYVSRASFPKPASDDEYYWVDLIGLAVVNREGVELGTVADLIDNGAHSVLRVRFGPADRPGEHLIPFVAAYVDDVDLAARRIRVDWAADY
jgi:16S rRNA processing protein RimM